MLDSASGAKPLTTPSAVNPKCTAIQIGAPLITDLKVFVSQFPDCFVVSSVIS